MPLDQGRVEDTKQWIYRAKFDLDLRHELSTCRSFTRCQSRSSRRPSGSFAASLKLSWEDEPLDIYQGNCLGERDENPSRG